MRGWVLRQENRARTREIVCDLRRGGERYADIVDLYCGDMVLRKTCMVWDSRILGDAEDGCHNRLCTGSGGTDGVPRILHHRTGIPRRRMAPHEVS